MLRAQGLGLWRGATCLFRDLDLELAPGEALVVQGPNGSGKTTLLRVLAGLTTPEEGRVLWAGQPLESVRQRDLLMAYCGHLAGLKPDLTVAENLDFFGRLYGCSRDRFASVMARLGLEALADLEVRFLSAGQKRRAALARVLLAAAPLWLLDEPQTNLDAAGQALVAALVGAHLAQGGLAVIATHQPLVAAEAVVRELVLGEVTG